MGYATIVSGGTDGRYTIALDYGEATRVALLAAVSSVAESLSTRVGLAQSALSAAEAIEAAQAAKYNAAVDAFISQHATVPAGAPRPDDSAVRLELQRLRALQLQNEPLRVNLAALKFERSQALKRVAYWTTFTATNTRSAWCTDYTDNATPGQVVATMDIPGDDNLIIIAPGCRAWTPADGVLSARELMSPEQVFFNAAIFPGWQIDKPTYRWGTVSAVDQIGNTLNVSLADATSSAQSLNVNRETDLSSVPVDYMGTGASIFEIGDRVVVQFEGQSWLTPRVLGFVDNPRPVGIWEAVTLAIITDVTLLALRVRSGADPDFSTVYAAATSSALVGSYRINRGSWQDLDIYVSTGLVEFVFDGEGPGTGFSLISMSPSYVGGYQMLFNVNAGTMGISSGSIVEARLLQGEEIIFNAAMVVLPAGDAHVAIVGRLLSENIPVLGGDQRTLTRLAYNLFETSGT